MPSQIGVTSEDQIKIIFDSESQASTSKLIYKNFKAIFSMLFFRKTVFKITRYEPTTAIQLILLHSFFLKINYNCSWFSSEIYILGRGIIQTADIFMMVAVSAERYKAICQPFTPRQPYYMYLAFVAVTSFSLEFPRFNLILETILLSFPVINAYFFRFFLILG